MTLLNRIMQFTYIFLYTDVQRFLHDLQWLAPAVSNSQLKPWFWYLFARSTLYLVTIQIPEVITYVPTYIPRIILTRIMVLKFSSYEKATKSSISKEISSKRQKKWEILSNFCDIIRTSELFKDQPITKHSQN